MLWIAAVLWFAAVVGLSHQKIMNVETKRNTQVSEMKHDLMADLMAELRPLETRENLTREIAYLSEMKTTSTQEIANHNETNRKVSGVLIGCGYSLCLLLLALLACSWYQYHKCCRLRRHCGYVEFRTQSALGSIDFGDFVREGDINRRSQAVDRLYLEAVGALSQAGVPEADTLPKVDASVQTFEDFEAREADLTELREWEVRVGGQSDEWRRHVRAWHHQAGQLNEQILSLQSLHAQFKSRWTWPWRTAAEREKKLLTQESAVAIREHIVAEREQILFERERDILSVNEFFGEQRQRFSARWQERSAMFGRREEDLVARENNLRIRLQQIDEERALLIKMIHRAALYLANRPASVPAGSLSTTASTVDEGNIAWSSNLQRRCSICLDPAPLISGVECQQCRYFSCNSCTEQYIYSELAQTMSNPTKFEQYRIRNGFIRCLGEGCASHLSDRVLAQHLSNRAWSEYRRAQYALARTIEQRVDPTEARERDEMARRRMRALCQGMRQCGRCGLGPIDSSGCSDLRAHHGEIRNGHRISNACPSCGWFSRNLQDWPAWDGRFQN